MKDNRANPGIYSWDFRESMVREFLIAIALRKSHRLLEIVNPLGAGGDLPGG